LNLAAGPPGRHGGREAVPQLNLPTCDVGTACPCCAGTTFVPYLSEDEIAKEIELRHNFIFKRLDHTPQPTELMDLTEFMHGGPGRLMACSRCGVVIRDEAQAAHYEDDFYDPALMNHLYPKYLTAFREKAPLYRELLESGANVVELGSHFGAFLQTAEEWNWRPIGIDIGASTSEFSRARGLTVRHQSISEFSLRRSRADALFIWNCFEQLETPGDTLVEAHRLLQPHGLLVVRVPNFGFYANWRRRMWNGSAQTAIRRLGHNNLLGFPYRFGYTAPALTRLLRQSGFDPLAGHDANLITMPFPAMPRWVKREYSEVRKDGVRVRNEQEQDPETVAGPWIEIVSRRAA